MTYLNYVNIKHGTDSQHRFSNGNTLPLTALPHSLAAFAPQTNSSRGSWWYHPKDRSIEGIRLTHQPSPWVGDFSYFCFMPQADGFFPNADSRWSGFRPNETELNPHYMKIEFLRYGATLNLSPTNSGAIMNVRFNDLIKQPRFAVLPFDFTSQINVDTEKRIISGYTTSKTNAPYHDNFKIWFVFEFDADIYDVLKTDDKSMRTSVAVSSFDFNVKLATSYISLEQAFCNLKRECGNKKLSDVKCEAQDIWEELLSRIEINADEEKMKTFYSCMYRAFLYPTKFYETDESGKNIHIDPESNCVKQGVSYTNNGFWDTYRTVYSFYSIVIPEKINEILEGYLNIYDDTGYLPRWPSPSEFGCMPGTLIEAVFADAVVKGLLTKENTERALTAMLKNAEVQSANIRQGRKCINEYNKYGYIPFDKCHESVNETLDCAYGDYCIGVVAKTLGKNDIANNFFARSKNYKNLFDAKTGFVRARDTEGNFRKEEFDSFAWGRDYTEGSVWQNGFAVPHDIEGLALLYGGADGLIKKIDELMMQKPYYHIGGYGREIHEMTEFAALDFGQCAISNQPSFHIPYIYSELGENKKTAYWVERLVNEAFSSKDNGYPGDEDNGTTACWYIFSCLGLYPMCPGKAEYVKGKMCVDKAVLKRPDGSKIDFSRLKFMHNKISHFVLDKQS